MLIFKTQHDLKQLEHNSRANRILRQCFQRSGHLEGYFVLIEEGDTKIHQPELRADLDALPFDGVFKTYGFYHAVYLTNNSFAIELIIPDKPWLSAPIKANLDSHLA